ncbi:TadE/TadG family type IV pilus assembly protein [Desulfovibrio inopinatus]|uniref:TadE/TadG family type IV pilus assembly protein n=1 Tax=Desulfovibrio inopinatus TaxID=102109 RepID=UPI00054EB5F0|nr:TadE/TadG family type IV pilus assembly protein [Desulfovibrio inopinatus]
MMRTTTNTAHQRGAGVVEMALLLPLMLVGVMGALEMTNVFHTWMVVQKAAQNGARLAVTGAGEADGVRLTLIKNETEAALRTLPTNAQTEVLVKSYTGGDLTSQAIDGNPGNPCDAVEVRVNVSYTPITPIVGDALPGVIDFSAYDRRLNEPWRPCGQ